MANTTQGKALFPVGYLFFVVTIILSLLPVYSSGSDSSTLCQGTYPTKPAKNATIFLVCRSGYNETIYHYAPSSTMISVCGVEPGSVTDVANILKLIGQYRVPFGVKGGGHTTNPGFSSTTGIQISMRRFQKVVYHQNNQTVDLGPGQVWDAVYKALEPYNINVLGGRVMGVGVAGYILGGGYSWKSGQYGLSMDTVREYQLVTPNGTVVYVNNHSYPDIFFGLKGGYNNFGIVTNFNMRAVPQTQVYGGILIYASAQFDAAIQTMTDFHWKNRDPKAQIIGSFLILGGSLNFFVLFFYDAPTPPSGTFDRFVSIPHQGNLTTQSFLALILQVDSSISLNLRVRYAVVSVTNISTGLLDGIRNRLISANKTLGSKQNAFFLINIEPLISSYLNNSQGGAYPHPASLTPLFPVELQYSWTSPADDAAFINEIKTTRDAILKIVLDEGQNVGGAKQILYPNYALEDTPRTQLYGKNVLRLETIRKAWDPRNIMCLAGGFKF